MTSFPYSGSIATGVIETEPAGPAERATAGSTRTATATARPAWERPALAGLLVATGVLYIWGLGASGWANAFYSAAAQAGSQNWEAFFYGSSDAGNSITVDKPPASLWVMELSVRLFGLSSWSILVPEALMGVGTVGVLYLAVRRVAGHAAGLVSARPMPKTTRPCTWCTAAPVLPRTPKVIRRLAAVFAIAVSSSATRFAPWDPTTPDSSTKTSR